MDFTEVKSRLSQLDVSQLCDITDQVRILDPAIRPIQPGFKMIGLAHTVNCHRDNLEFFNALIHARADEVLVVAANGAKRALFGEIMSTAAKQKAVAGIVCDGACRDLSEMKKLNLPIFVKHVYPRAVKRAKWGERQVPIVCGEVDVYPGDIVFGDDDGVVVIDPEALIKILPEAEALRKKEKKVLQHLASGKGLDQIFKNFDAYYTGIKDGKPIQLEWDES